MSFKGHDVDDTYADDEQHFIKIYFDFDTEEECFAFAEWAEDNWNLFQDVVDEFERSGE